jgi:hypothetical protein
MDLDLSNQEYNKFKGVSPEGFVLVPHEMLESLKDFDVWMEFKYSDSGWMERKSAELFSTKNQE